MIKNFEEANVAINDVYATTRDGLREELRDKLSKVISTAIMPEKVSHFAEIVYANQADFSTEIKAVAAEVCDFATSYGFYGLGEDDRGIGISTILNGGTLTEEPEPKSEFVVAEV